jgi:RimJ/RimL family protein N-acetyltransferase
MLSSGTPQLELRNATREDWRLLLKWRNDADTCRWSRTGTKVEEAEHRAWLAGVLADSDRQLLIGELDGCPVGTARLDRSSGAIELSWTVSPEMRGKGYGGALVRLALQRANGYVFAIIHHENTASERIARAVGMRLESSRAQWLRYSVVVPARRSGD